MLLSQVLKVVEMREDGGTVLWLVVFSRRRVSRGRVRGPRVKFGLFSRVSVVHAGRHVTRMPEIINGRVVIRPAGK